MSLEDWIINLLNDISKEAEIGGNFDLHLEAEHVQEIAKQYENIEWFEIY